MREPFWRARVCVTTLLILEVIVGVILIAVTAFFHSKMGAFLPSMERKMLGGQFFNTYILGIQLIVTYMCSYAMWKRIWSRRFTPNIQLLLSIWMFFCFLIVLCGFGTIWSLFTCADAIANSAESSLIKGIDLYYTCPEWKLLWDSLQYHKECCGVNEYKDWMKASWMPRDTAKSDGDTYCSNNTFDDMGNNGWDVRKRSSDMAMAPYACCKHSCTTCYQNYVPRAGNGTGNPPVLNINQINTKGCLPQFIDTLYHILYSLLALVVIAFKVDIIICSLAKYIIVKNQQQESGQAEDNVACLGDDGRPQVVVKFPPNVRLMALEEREENVSERYEGGEEIVVETCACCPNYINPHEHRTPRRSVSSCGCPNTIIH